MSDATLKVGTQWDGKAIKRGTQEAGKDVNLLTKNVKGVTASLESLKQIAGVKLFGDAMRILGEQMKQVIDLSDRGVKLVSDEDVKNMREVLGLMDETKNSLTSWGARLGATMIGGMQSFIAYLGARSGGASSEDAWKIASAQKEEAKTNDERIKVIEAQKKAAEATEKLRQSSLTDQEKLLESETKMVNAVKQYNAEMRNGGKDLKFLAEQEVIIAEESAKQLDLRERIAKEEKRITDEIQKQNNERASKLAKYRNDELEIAHIRKQAALVGASLEEQISANKEDQLRVQKEIARAGGEEWIAKRKELEELKVKENELEKKREDRDKKAEDIRAQAQEDIAKLYQTKGREVSSGALAGASMGMYLGGTSRHKVGMMSRQEALQMKANEILERMDRALQELKDG